MKAPVTAVADFRPELSELKEGIGWEEFVSSYGYTPDNQLFQERESLRQRILALPGLSNIAQFFVRDLRIPTGQLLLSTGRVLESLAAATRQFAFDAGKLSSSISAAYRALKPAPIPP